MLLLNPDGGRLKLGSLASTQCTGLVAKYTVGPLSLDTRWAVKRPSLITSKNTRRSHPQAVCSMHTLARSRLAVCSMQVAATREGCLLHCTLPDQLSCLLDASRSHPRRLSAPKHLAEQLFSFCCSRPSRTSAQGKIKFVL